MRRTKKALATILSFLMCFSLFTNIAHAETPIIIDSSDESIVSDEMASEGIDSVENDYEDNDNEEIIEDDSVSSLIVESDTEVNSEEDIIEDKDLTETSYDSDGEEIIEDNNAFEENINLDNVENDADNDGFDSVVNSDLTENNADITLSENSDIVLSDESNNTSISEDIDENYALSEDSDIDLIESEAEVITEEQTVFMANAENSVEINETNFPDPVFRQYVIDNFDYINDGILDEYEISDAKEIIIYNSNLESLSGIEFFTYLELLNCSENELLGLDISSNINLKELNCSSCSLNSLDVSNNINLERIECFYNNLSSIDLSNNSLLSTLYCENNKLESLDLSHNTQLKHLFCNQNEILDLDISNCNYLIECLSSDYEINNNFEIFYMYSDNYNYYSLELDLKTNLTPNHPDFSIVALINDENFPDEKFREYVYSLDIDNDNCLSNFEANSVTQIDLSYSDIYSLKGLEYFVNLYELVCNSNNLTTLDLSRNPKLGSLNCNENNLTEINLSNNLCLTYLNCNNNDLTILDLSNNTQLNNLNCSSNQLTTIILPESASLEYISCEDNLLTELNVSKVENLRYLFCQNNLLTNLDLTNCHYLIETINTTLQYNLNLNIKSFYRNDGTSFLRIDFNTILMPVSSLELLGEPIAEINEINFPDNNFRDIVKQYDFNSDNILSEGEISGVRNLLLNDLNIFSLKGIEYFTNLEELNCSSNFLIDIDISNNINLRSLNCNQNELTFIDLSNNVNLYSLYCCDNNISSITFPENNTISFVNCSNNTINEINLSNLRNIKTLYCQGNNINVLDITNCPGLLDALNGYYDLNSLNRSISFSGDNSFLIADYSISFVPEFSLDIYGQPVVDINEDNFPDPVFREYILQFDLNDDNILSEGEIESIKSINLYNSGVNSLKGIEYLAELTSLDCSYNELTILDISNNIKLYELICNYNKLDTLNTGNNCLLRYLSFEGNNISEIDLSSNDLLDDLNCSNNQLCELDLSFNMNLRSLYCNNNSLEFLDLNANTLLNNLNCGNNQLQELNISNNTLISTLDCYNNRLSNLDITYNLELRELDCSDNDLLQLNISNSRYLIIAANSNVIFSNGIVYCEDTENWSYLTFDSNTNLIPSFNVGNIIVDIDEEYFPDDIFREYIINNFDFDKDGSLSELEINGVLNIAVNNYYYDDIHPRIQSLEGIEFFTNLRSLDCTYNDITDLNLSNNLLLTSLRCGENQLSNLDLSKNVNLQYLSCYGNSLNHINLVHNVSLTELDCCNNPLAVLDISKCIYLKYVYMNGNYNYMQGFVKEYTGYAESEQGDTFYLMLSIPDNTSLISDENYFIDSNLIVQLNIDTFPDDNFRAFIDKYDIDSDGWLCDKEIDLIKNIEWNYYNQGNITSFEGIEYLSSLESLCINNVSNLNSLDLTENTNLTHLDCNNCWNVPIQLNKNNDFKYLSFRSCNLKELDISNYENLEYLDINENFLLNDLDLSNNINLKYLDFLYTDIKVLDISSCDYLVSVLNDLDAILGTELYYGSEDIRLIFGTNTLLIYPGSGVNEIVADINEDTFPDYYFREYVNRFDFDFDGKLNLAEINSVSSINLNYSYSWSNEINDYVGLKSLKGIELFTNLTSLYLESNYLLNDIDLSQNVNLKYLTISNNYNLTELDISQNTSIEQVNCSSCSNLSSLILGNNSNLKYLTCQNTKLNTLDITFCEQLSEIVPDNFVLSNRSFAGENSRLYVDSEVEIIYPTGSIRTCDIVVYPNYDQAKQFVESLYANILNRNPDDDEISVYTERLMSGELKGSDLAYELLSGNEFAEKNTSNTEFISILYFSLFGRIPDPDSGAYYISKLDSGEFSREYILSGFINSAEFKTLCGNYNIETAYISIQNTKNITFLAGEGDLIGSGEMSPIKVNYGEYYIIPECQFTAPDGYEFYEWLVNSDNNVQYFSVGNELYVKTDIVLTAVWSVETSDVIINSENFPDDNFRNFVNRYDADSDGILNKAERDSVTSIEIYEMATPHDEIIKSFKGIEHFKSLNKFILNNNYAVTELDFSENKKLTDLTCYSCSQLINLDISQNDRLKYLSVYMCNKLENLDISNNKNLEKLNILYSGLKVLDISECKMAGFINICYLYEDTNSLYYSYDNTFENLYFSLSIDKATKLIYLKGDELGSVVTDINEDVFPDETFRNYIIKYDQNSDNKLSEKEIEFVTSINLNGKSITTLKGIEFLTNLKTLRIALCQLNDIDLTSNKEIVLLDCGNNNLSELDISQNSKLDILICRDNNLGSIDFSQNANLKILNCSGNPLQQLDISNSDIRVLSCSNCNLNQLKCNNDMYYIDCSNNNLSDIHDLNFTLDYISSYDYYNDDGLIEYVSYNGPTLIIGNNNFSMIDISDFDVLYDFDCSNNNISSLDFSNNGSLYNLNCSNNKLTKLDISNNNNLYNLDCNNNLITSLKRSNASLGWLYCNNNLLTELDAANILYGFDCSNNEITSLEIGSNGYYFRCYNNNISTLDVSNNTSLVRYIYHDTKDGKTIYSSSPILTNWSNFDYLIVDDFTKVIPLSTEYQVSFNSGFGEIIGSGTMLNTYIEEDGDYTLPSCEFISPVGYEFDKWAVKIGESDIVYKKAGETISVTEDTTVTAVWKAKTNIAYIVEHYKQELNGEYNSDPEVETLSGTTGANITPDVKNYDGFDSPDAQSVVIEGDGSTRVEYYYTRNSYTLTWDYNGGTASGDYTIGSLKFETPIIAPPLTRTGYTFDGWNVEVPSSMPSNDLTIKAVWTPKTDIAYVVEHYKQDLNGEYSSSPEVQNLSGTADATVKPAVNNYEGFKKPSVKSVTIKADGSLVVKYYYKRNSYNLTWDLKGGTATGDYTTGSVKYESPITAPKPTKTGYKFNGWNISVPSEMPSSDLTIEAKWKARTDTVYKVEHYKQGLDGKYTAKPATEKFTGKTGASVTPKVKKYSGYKSPEVKTVKIKADGSLVVKYYYTRNKYTLKWDYAGGKASGTFTNGKIMYGTKITAPKPTRKGYTFNGWSATVSKTMPAKNLTYKAKWKINSYTLTWNLNGGTASNKYTSGKIKYNTKITAPIPTKEGYVFDGWSVSVPSKMPAKNLKITAKWRERTQEELVTDFVKRFYSEVLQRSQKEIDADTAGINDWTNKLVSGQEDGANVAYGFVYSSEFQNKKVSDEEYVLILYHAFFGRDPFDPNNYDAGGYNNWVNKLKNGTDRMDVLAGFINSAEFQNLCNKYNIKRGTLVPSQKPAYRKAHNLP